MAMSPFTAGRDAGELLQVRGGGGRGGYGGHLPGSPVLRGQDGSSEIVQNCTSFSNQRNATSQSDFIGAVVSRYTREMHVLIPKTATEGGSSAD